MLSIGSHGGDSALLFIGHFWMGGVLWSVGRTETALDHLLQEQSLYDEKVHASVAYVY
jgi:hypothetical protein